MRVAISTDGGYVSHHFERCPHFTIIDIGSRNVIRKKMVANPGCSPEFISRFLYENGVDLIVVDRMGMYATEFSGELGIKSIVGTSGRIDEVIGRLLEGNLKESLQWQSR